MPEDTPGIAPEAIPGFDPATDVVLDPRSLRGLAHPLRLRLRSELIEGGPATASQLALRIGESSGATSYHLRQLAAHGFVAEETGRGSGRERYWRAVHRATWYGGPSTEDLEERQLGGEYMRAVARLYADRVLRFADSTEAAEETLGPEWARSGEMSDHLLDLTPEQAREISRQIHALCEPFRRQSDESPPGKRKVVLQFQVLPLPEER